MASRAEELRKQGNELFSKGDWQRAIGKYTRCIHLLERQRRAATSPAAADDQQQLDAALLAAYSNRAQARLNSGEHAAALEDAERALELDPAHAKSMLRKARALHEMKLFQEAVSAYRTVLEQSPGGGVWGKKLEEDMRQAEVADKQSRLGVFELEAWWSSDLTGTPPALADFVGPVEIRDAGAGLGRGVFVTEDVQAGQLLFAISPTAHLPLLHGPLTNDQGLELVTQLLKATRAAQADARNCSSFPSLQFLVRVHSMLGHDTPPIRFFKPVNALSAKDRSVTEEDLRNPAVTAKYSLETMAQIVTARSFSNETEVAVHALGSFLNHSCLPNTEFRQVQVGTVKMARATRDLKAGTELRFPYTDTFCPIADRMQNWARWQQPFRCTCARCGLEQALLEQVPALKALSLQCSAMWSKRSDISGMSEQAKWNLRKTCVACIKRVEGQLKGNPHCGGLDEEKKNWIRSSFLPFYKLMLEPGMVKSLWEPGATLESKLEFRRLIHQAVVAIADVDPGSTLATNLVGRELFASFLQKLQFDPKVEDLVDRFGKLAYGDGMDKRTYAILLQRSAGIVL